MNTPSERVLVVDDDRAMCVTLERGLVRAGYDVVTASTGSEALDLLATDDFDVVVTDLQLGGMNGLELCKRTFEVVPGLPVIVITAFGSLESAIGAIRAGAYDFVSKPVDVELIGLAIARAVEFRRLKTDLQRLRQAVGEFGGAGELLGNSSAMRRVGDLVGRVRDSDVTVLITGESGSGKEVVARNLHRTGRRAAGPFVAVNCAALPDHLLESELFGHVRGAFTDAKSARTGLLLQATSGTLFLDEVGEMPLQLQPKLLRALQDRTVRPVGSDREIPFDVRIVAATNKDLVAAVERGTFREDLYYRLNVFEIELPPLRVRETDILLLAQHFLSEIAQQSGKEIRGLAPEVARRMLDYRWPGNVRELRNCVERAVALARFDQITVDDLPERVRDSTPDRLHRSAPEPDGLVSLEEVERRHIARVLEAVGGQRAAAAKVLGIDRKTLFRKLERWNQDSEPER